MEFSFACVWINVIMRYALLEILSQDLRFLAIKTRNNFKITQKEMSKRLYMSESSYSDIETGRSTCGTLTTILLLNMQDDPKAFLQNVTKKFADWYEKEMQQV